MCISSCLKYEQSDSKQSQHILQCPIQIKQKIRSILKRQKSISFNDTQKCVKQIKRGDDENCIHFITRDVIFFLLYLMFLCLFFLVLYTFCSYYLFDMLMSRFCFIEERKISRSIWHTLRKLKAKCNMCILSYESITIYLKGGKLVEVKELYTKVLQNVILFQCKFHKFECN